MEKEVLEKAIRESWFRNTCYSCSIRKWNPQNSSIGQCVVTALVIQDYLGGELLYCKHHDHYWNRLSSGEEVDITKNQFSNDVEICKDEIKSRNDILKSEGAIKSKTLQRYNLLKKRVKERLETDSPINL
jgi:hypothetical protein